MIQTKINNTASRQLPSDASTIVVEGMTCASCGRHVEKSLSKVPGVLKASVNLATNKASVQHDPSVQREALYRAIEHAGYHPVTEGEPQQSASSLHKNPFKKPLILAALLTLPIFLLEMIPMIIPAVGQWLYGVLDHSTSSTMVFLLATAIQFGPAKLFYSAGWRGLIHGSPNMNTLVMLGTSAAYGYSVVLMFFPTWLPNTGGHGYFEAASMVITLVLLGKHLEHLAKSRTSSAIQKLIALQPRTAKVVLDGKESEVPVESVKVGDHVRIRAGDRVPLDGEIVGGMSFLDESMISGESLPVERSVGDPVIGGTQNLSGSFVFEVKQVGTETVLSKIVKMVEDAQGSKPAIQALADKVIAVFVPIVLGLALVTFLAWLLFGSGTASNFAIGAAVAVLIIACPCAMGLATPTSIMVSTGRGAELGTLFRNPEALETLAHVDVFAFDKTGTLTLGKPELTDLQVADGNDEELVLQVLGSLETHSNHPVAQAVVRAVLESGTEIVEVEQFQEIAGRGVSGKVGAMVYYVGSHSWMTELGLSTDGLDQPYLRFAEKGMSTAFLASSERLLAVLAVADVVKESSAIAIERLKNEGKEVVMITGDDERVARAIARSIGISNVIAEVLPQDKANIVKELQRGGRKVAFIGDGINDAPALAQADVGIAMGTGSDIAIETGDVILMNGDVTSVSKAANLSRLTIKNIKQNLFWAFAYNVLLIPVAAGVLYPSFGITLSPALAAAAMGISSIFVLGNSLRLKKVALG